MVLVGSQAEKDKTKLEKLQGELESLYFEHSNLNDRILTVASNDNLNKFFFSSHLIRVFLLCLSKASSKWKTHLRSKISKLSSKVKLKIAALNKLKIKEKKIELEKQGLDVDSAEVKIEEVTFDHFTSGTFPWESSNDSKAFIKFISILKRVTHLTIYLFSFLQRRFSFD